MNIRTQMYSHLIDRFVQRGALDKQNLEGSVARRLKLVNSGEEALAYSGKRPPSFIEMPATTTSMAESGSLSTNYINV